MYLYGGHLGDGNTNPDRARKGKEYSLARYNEERESQPPPQPGVVITQASPARPSISQTKTEKPQPAPASVAPQNPLMIRVQALLTFLGLGDLLAVCSPDLSWPPRPSEARVAATPQSRHPAALQAALDRGCSVGPDSAAPLAVNPGLPMTLPARPPRL
jgi:hypothetical protein